MWLSTISSALFLTILCSAKPQQNFDTDDNPYNCVCIPDHQCPEDYGINSKFITCAAPGNTCCVPSNVTSLDKTRVERDSRDGGCGRRRLNIANLQSNEGIAQFGEFPWMIALLQIKKSDVQDSDYLVYTCGGSLIHPRAVLTAAHCVIPFTADELVIRAGEWDPRRVDEPLPHQDRAVQEIIMREDYDESCHCNDLAILILSSPVKLAEHINVVCLPDRADLIRPSCVATGWGKHASNRGPDIVKALKKVELPPFGDRACQNAYRRNNPNFFLDKSLICAGGKRGLDTCTGDSGGPLVCRLGKDRTRYAQLGVVAAGETICGTFGFPGLHTSIRNFLDWIDEKMILNNLDINVYRYKP